MGFVQPILVRGNEIIDGHARVESAKKLGIEKIPCIDLMHLNADEVRLLRLAVNKLPERATWDPDALQREFTYQLEIDADLSVSGFGALEIDAALSFGKAYSEPDTIEPVAEPDQPDMSTVTQLGDKWQLGKHLVLGGNARSEDNLEELLGGDDVSLAFVDPPHNVSNKGHVTSCDYHPESTRRRVK